MKKSSIKKVFLFALLVNALALSGCGYKGALFLPGQGAGFYKTHNFDGTLKNKEHHKEK